MRSIAQASGFSSHRSLYGARYLTVVTRCGLATSWSVLAPFGQRRPSFTGDAGLPSIAMILAAFVNTRRPHPMAQYGHTLWVTSAPRRRDCVAAVRGLNGSCLLTVSGPPWYEGTAEDGGLHGVTVPARIPAAV